MHYFFNAVGDFVPFRFSVPFGGIQMTQVNVVETLIKPLTCKTSDIEVRIIWLRLWRPSVLAWTLDISSCLTNQNVKRSRQNLSGKLGQQSAICWNSLGLFRDYGLNYIFSRKKPFLFFKIESWNFQHLFYLDKQKSFFPKKYDVYHVPWIVLSSANRCHIVS